MTGAEGEMILKFKTELESLASYLPPFLKLADAKRWKGRAVQLGRDAMRSPFQAKIVADYHWLELALSEQMVMYEAYGSLVPSHMAIESITALYFAQTVVEVHRHLSASGRKVLEGRIRDALNVEAGFASLYLEMTVARRLFDDGYQVEFSDMEGLAQFDLQFWKGDVQGEVECKSLSCDAGRKIHRKDFYRFMDAIGDTVQTHALSGKNEVIVITLKDRLPADNKRQSTLREAVRLFILDPTCTEMEQDFFKIRRHDFNTMMGNISGSDEREFYGACQTLFGPNCHLSGLKSEDGVCLLVMLSQNEDDTSKPLLEAMKKAATQFSGTRPAFIAVQFDDILPSDLLLVHLRRRVGLLSYYLFLQEGASHVISIRFTAYKSLVANDAGIGEPGFAVPNPKPCFQIISADYSPLIGSIPDVEFARLLGKLPPTESISHISFESP
jgi:hypothetical protein